MREAFDKIDRICVDILAITDDELSEAIEVANAQIDYLNPLSQATTNMLNEAGEHNIEVLNELRNLRDTIKKGATITALKNSNQSNQQ